MLEVINSLTQADLGPNLLDPPNWRHAELTLLRPHSLVKYVGEKAILKALSLDVSHLSERKHDGTGADS